VQVASDLGVSCGFAGSCNQHIRCTATAAQSDGLLRDPRESAGHLADTSTAAHVTHVRVRPFVSGLLFLLRRYSMALRPAQAAATAGLPTNHLRNRLAAPCDARLVPES
jgi:hypothetical protein